MRVLRLGPEIRHGEARLKVRAEVVHPSDRKHDVHPEFENFEIRATHDEVREVARVRFLSWNLGIGRGQVWVTV